MLSIKAGHPIDCLKNICQLDEDTDIVSIIRKYTPLALHIDPWHEVLVWHKLVALKKKYMSHIVKNFGYSLFLNCMVICMMHLFRVFVYPKMMQLYENFKLDTQILVVSDGIFGFVLAFYGIGVLFIGIVIALSSKYSTLLLVLGTRKIVLFKSLITYRYMNVISIFQEFSYSNYQIHEILKQCNDKILRWQSYLVLEALIEKGSETSMYYDDVFNLSMTNSIKYSDGQIKSDILEVNERLLRFKIKKIATTYRVCVYLMILTFIAVCVNIQLAPMRIMEGL